MKRKVLYFFIFIIILIFAVIKLLKPGNNISNKSADEIEEYILNINSYKTKAEIVVKSNKTTNKYIVEQQYIKNNNIYTQKLIEPNNINGLTIIYQDNNLKVDNSNLNLSKLYNNYKYIADSNISLQAFIKDYMNCEEKDCKEEDEQIVLTVKLKNGNKYIDSKTLYIDKKTCNPVRLEIENLTQKVLVYILYNEIKINNLQEEDILAFKLDIVNNNI